MILKETKKSVLLILISAGILIFNSFNLKAQVANPTGEMTFSDPDDIWAQTLEGSHYNEFWNYHFYLNDDITLYVTFSVANFGSLKSAVSGLQVSIHNMGDQGQVYQLSREYNLNHLVQDRERYMFRNRMEREIYFEGKLPESHRIRINTSKDGITYNIDLQFDNIERGLKWGDGMYRINDEMVGIITHIPYAEVNGFVNVDGHHKDVSGTAYMDHTFQNQTTTRLVDSGFRFVNHQNNQNWDLIYSLLPRDHQDRKTIGYRIKKRNGNIRMTGIENITTLDKSRAFGDSVADQLEFRLSNDEKIQIHRQIDIERFSVLSELNRLARSVARRFLGGEVIHFRGEAYLTDSQQRNQRGYYNYFIVD